MKSVFGHSTNAVVGSILAVSASLAILATEARGASTVTPKPVSNVALKPIGGAPIPAPAPILNPAPIAILKPSPGLPVHIAPPIIHPILPTSGNCNASTAAMQACVMQINGFLDDAKTKFAYLSTQYSLFLDPTNSSSVWAKAYAADFTLDAPNNYPTQPTSADASNLQNALSQLQTTCQTMNQWIGTISTDDAIVQSDLSQAMSIALNIGVGMSVNYPLTVQFQMNVEPSYGANISKVSNQCEKLVAILSPRVAIAVARSKIYASLTVATTAYNTWENDLATSVALPNFAQLHSDQVSASNASLAGGLPALVATLNGLSNDAQTQMNVLTPVYNRLVSELDSTQSLFGNAKDLIAASAGTLSASEIATLLTHVPFSNHLFPIGGYNHSFNILYGQAQVDLKSVLAIQTTIGNINTAIAKTTGLINTGEGVIKQLDFQLNNAKGMEATASKLSQSELSSNSTDQTQLGKEKMACSDPSLNATSYSQYVKNATQNFADATTSLTPLPALVSTLVAPLQGTIQTLVTNLTNQITKDQGTIQNDSGAFATVVANCSTDEKIYFDAFDIGVTTLVTADLALALPTNTTSLDPGAVAKGKADLDDANAAFKGAVDYLSTENAVQLINKDLQDVRQQAISLEGGVNGPLKYAMQAQNESSWAINPAIKSQLSKLAADAVAALLAEVPAALATDYGAISALATQAAALLTQYKVLQDADNSMKTAEQLDTQSYILVQKANADLVQARNDAAEAPGATAAAADALSADAQSMLTDATAQAKTIGTSMQTALTTATAANNSIASQPASAFKTQLQQRFQVISTDASTTKGYPAQANGDVAMITKAAASCLAARQQMDVKALAVLIGTAQSGLTGVIGKYSSYLSTVQGQVKTLGSYDGYMQTAASYVPSGTAYFPNIDIDATNVNAIALNKSVNLGIKGVLGDLALKVKGSYDQANATYNSYVAAGNPYVASTKPALDAVSKNYSDYLVQVTTFSDQASNLTLDMESYYPKAKDNYAYLAVHKSVSELNQLFVADQATHLADFQKAQSAYSQAQATDVRFKAAYISNNSYALKLDVGILNKDMLDTETYGEPAGAPYKAFQPQGDAILAQAQALPTGNVNAGRAVTEATVLQGAMKTYYSQIDQFKMYTFATYGNDNATYQDWLNNGGGVVHPGPPPKSHGPGYRSIAQE